MALPALEDLFDFMKRGFTLTELLIVIVIIAALAGIVFPIGMSVKRKAQGVTCMSKLKDLGVGLEGYLFDHNDVMPPWFIGRKSRSEDAAVLEVELLLYLGDDKFAFKCPSDHEHFKESGSSYFWNENLSNLRRTRLTLMGARADSAMIPLIFDKEAYHGKKNGVNFLYSDQSVSSIINFKTSSRD